MQNQDFCVFVTSDLYLCNKSQLTHRDDADAGRTSDFLTKSFFSVLRKNVLANGNEVLEGNIAQFILSKLRLPSGYSAKLTSKYALKLVGEKIVSSQRKILAKQCETSRVAERVNGHKTHGYGRLQSAALLTAILKSIYT